MATAKIDYRATLTPQMLRYEEKFSDAGEIRWLPYLMYFHPANHRSEVVNTDAIGFRFATTRDGRPIAVENAAEHEVVSLLAGSSTVFGIGATSDDATMPSRLNRHAREGSPPWLNFGGRSHNSAQELLLYALHRHRLPRTERCTSSTCTRPRSRSRSDRNGPAHASPPLLRPLVPGRIVSMIRVENDASANVARKLGMNIEREVDYHGFKTRVWVSQAAEGP